MYPENPVGTQVIVGSMNMGYISDTARNRTHNLFRPKRESIPLGHSDGYIYIYIYLTVVIDRWPIKNLDDGRIQQNINKNVWNEQAKIVLLLEIILFFIFYFLFSISVLQRCTLLVNA